MRYLSMTILALFLIAGCSGGEKNTAKTPSPAKSSAGAVSLEELAKWCFLGTGTVGVDAAENALLMSETDGSVGVTLVSPKSYGKNVTVSFKVKPSTYESVNVVMLSASDVASGGEIKVPADYDGAFGFWTAEQVQNYVVAFHNGAHNRLPFIVKCPGMEPVAEGEKHVAGERWHDVEIGREDSKIWLKIDGALVVEGNDSSAESLPGGAIAFRLRGTATGLASALFKDVVITEN